MEQMKGWAEAVEAFTRDMFLPDRPYKDWCWWSPGWRPQQYIFIKQRLPDSLWYKSGPTSLYSDSKGIKRQFFIPPASGQTAPPLSGCTFSAIPLRRDRSQFRPTFIQTAILWQQGKWLSVRMGVWGLIHHSPTVRGGHLSCSYLCQSAPARLAHLPTCLPARWL